MSLTSIDEEKENQDQASKPFVLNRLRAASSQTSIFDRLSISKKRASVFNCLKSDDVESFLKKTYPHKRRQEVK